MQIDYNNKRVLVTGATRGIGKSIADCLYECGANLILTGTNLEEISLLNKRNRDSNILNVRYLHADFSDINSCDLFLDEINKYETIDVCINNAGINIVNDFLETNDKEFSLIQEVNINLPVKILKVVGPKMIKNKYGRILNIASIWSVVNRPSRSAYSISKNALVGLTNSLSVEWASNNILVNSLSPGFTLTELTKKTNSPKQLESISELIPLKRLALTDEIARPAVFLCSDLNSYINGQNIIVDGGYSRL